MEHKCTLRVLLLYCLTLDVTWIVRLQGCGVMVGSLEGYIVWADGAVLSCNERILHGCWFLHLIELFHASNGLFLVGNMVLLLMAWFLGLSWLLDFWTCEETWWWVNKEATSPNRTKLIWFGSGLRDGERTHVGKLHVGEKVDVGELRNED